MLIREVVKNQNGFFTVRLTERVNPPPLTRSPKKKWVLKRPKKWVFKGPKIFTNAYGQADRKKAVLVFDCF